MKRWSWELGRCVAPLVLGGLVVVARPAPNLGPVPLLVPFVWPSSGGGTASLPYFGPQSTDRMLIEPDGARYDSRFAVTAPPMDRGMVVRPRVVGLPVGPGR